MADESLPEILVRYGPPHKLDKAPYQTKCRVILSTLTNICDIYVQMSKDSDDPRWELVETNLAA